MADNKFKFDPESLQFEGQNLSFKVRFIKMVSGLLVSGIIIAFALLLISSYVIIPPSTRKKMRENEKLKKELLILTKRFLQTEKVLEDIKKRDENIYKVIMESDPNEENRTDTTSGTLSQMLNKMEEVDEWEIAQLIDHNLDSLLNYLQANEKSFKDLATVIANKERMLANIPSIQPVKNDDLELIVYGFGKRIDPMYKTPAFHDGIDYGIPEGTKVYATADGKISFAGQKRGEGKIIIISHGFGFTSKYAHLSKVLVPRGKKVSRGDVIGLSGNTGKSMTPHLHYEVLVNDKEVNPVNFYFADLNPDEYDLMIRLSSKGGLSLD